MKAKVVRNNDGTLELQVNTPLTLNKASRSGNSTVIATTRGQQYIGNLNGHPTYLQLNVLQMEAGAAGGGIFEVEAEEGSAPRKRAA